MKIGVSFTVPIEEVMSHVAVVLGSRASLDQANGRYTNLLKGLEKKTFATQEEILVFLREMAAIRKDLLTVDQALEDTTAILNGYFNFIGQQMEQTKNQSEQNESEEQGGQ